MSLDIWFTIPLNTGKEIIQHEVFSTNVTHNLNTIAEKAGIYEALWHKQGITKAEDYIELLSNTLVMMKNHPNYFKQFDASNGWGTYEHFVPWLERLLEACHTYPIADVGVSI